MSLAKFLGRLRVLDRNDSRATTARICSSAEMRRHVARERARANRTGGKFSILVFLPAEASTPAETAQFTAALARRIRSTDVIGWVADGVLGALLPDTSNDGATRLANDICRGLSTGLQVPRYDVHTYPTVTPAPRLPKVESLTDHEASQAACY